MPEAGEASGKLLTSLPSASLKNPRLAKLDCIKFNPWGIRQISLLDWEQLTWAWTAGERKPPANSEKKRSRFMFESSLNARRPTEWDRAARSLTASI